MADFRHAHLDRGADRFAPHLGAFVLLGPVIEHLFHAMLRRVADVHAEQIIRFAGRFPVFRGPGVMHFFEYRQGHYHCFTFVVLRRDAFFPDADGGTQGNDFEFGRR